MGEANCLDDVNGEMKGGLWGVVSSGGRYGALVHSLSVAGRHCGSHSGGDLAVFRAGVP